MSAADRLVAATKADTVKFQSFAAAQAAGYVRIGSDPLHYVNWKVILSKDVLDPEHPSVLMYQKTQSGKHVFVGAMYVGPGLCKPGPDVGGSLTPWHAHNNLCLNAEQEAVGSLNRSGTCVEGSHSTSTYFMLHVWTAPSVIAAGYQFNPEVPAGVLSKVELPVAPEGVGTANATILGGDDLERAPLT